MIGTSLGVACSFATGDKRAARYVAKRQPSPYQAFETEPHEKAPI
jgi:hypothetical protein